MLERRLKLCATTNASEDMLKRCEEAKKILSDHGYKWDEKQFKAVKA